MSEHSIINVIFVPGLLLSLAELLCKFQVRFISPSFSCSQKQWPLVSTKKCVSTVTLEEETRRELACIWCFILWQLESAEIKLSHYGAVACLWKGKTLQLVVLVDQIVRYRFGRMNAVSDIPGRTPSFLIILLGNGCGASQQFFVQRSCVMSGCHIRRGQWVVGC